MLFQLVEIVLEVSIWATSVQTQLSTKLSKTCVIIPSTHRKDGRSYNRGRVCKTIELFILEWIWTVNPYLSQSNEMPNWKWRLQLTPQLNVPSPLRICHQENKLKVKMQRKSDVYLHSFFSFRLKDYLFPWKKTGGPCSLGGSSLVFLSGWWRELRPKIRYCSDWHYSAAPNLQPVHVPNYSGLNSSQGTMGRHRLRLPR